MNKTIISIERLDIQILKIINNSLEAKNNINPVIEMNQSDSFGYLPTLIGKFKSIENPRFDPK